MESGGPVSGPDGAGEKQGSGASWNPLVRGQRGRRKLGSQRCHGLGFCPFTYSTCPLSPDLCRYQAQPGSRSKVRNRLCPPEAQKRKCAAGDPGTQGHCSMGPQAQRVRCQRGKALLAGTQPRFMGRGAWRVWGQGLEQGSERDWSWWCELWLEVGWRCLTLTAPGAWVGESGGL